MKGWFMKRLSVLLGKSVKRDYSTEELRDSAQRTEYDAALDERVAKEVINHAIAKESAKYDSKRGNGLHAGLEIVFYRLEEVMKKEKPFLDRNFSLEKLSLKAGTNRTYASNAINSIAGCSFNKYVNVYRLEYATGVSQNSASLVEIEEIAVMSGYKDVRSFLIALYDAPKDDFKYLKNKYLCGIKKQKSLF